MKHVASVSVRLHECQDRTCHCDVKDTPEDRHEENAPSCAGLRGSAVREDAGTRPVGTL